ncbi:hypothetical protein DdX_14685 [Ditylenchus destructor]|uniref:Uncharacterized protein n=1 Tax=Ditylenchus destructor TaxID=166010 RepID=A0AAD4R1P3_9BILA|nr:hypothetical protein DdX_14685 [Ditylenchus destructor]
MERNIDLLTDRLLYSNNPYSRTNRRLRPAERREEPQGRAQPSKSHRPEVRGKKYVSITEDIDYAHYMQQGRRKVIFQPSELGEKIVLIATYGERSRKRILSL